LTATVFVIFNYAVTRRQRKLLSTATRSDAILSSLFPAKVRDQLMAEQAEQEERTTGIAGVALRGKASKATEERVSNSSKPIADLFPNTTV
jgi:hypothetical protein